MTHNRDGSESGKVLVRVDPDLADLIPGFLENRRRDMGRIWEALARNDYETIRILGHSMEGEAAPRPYLCLSLRLVSKNLT